uniref:hypothetical protein n=1 Tax=Polaribacter sp. TaxID=1920175 RepID=UPI004048CD9B
MKINIKELVLLFVLYFIGAISISVIYFTEKDDSILYFSILFLIFLLINRQALKFYKSKNKTLKFIVFSLVPFFVYLLLVGVFGENFFIRYKALISIPMIFSIYLIFKHIKIGVK